ncbi:hypothetical protein Vadar_026948 [Vaccinium darrowii]|uniref:Uncharacterized protein n=1 Tax=Vaccinium darrowii TaxID=229202 RepID=A0ACB7YHF3_9ERIC|nr:hypothetical protein Vadar_026948 [Vaccinium darrowii]
MYLKLLSRLPLKALGSLCAVRRVNTGGIWSLMRKSALLPLGMLPQAEDFHTFPFSAASNYSPQSGNLCGAASGNLDCVDDMSYEDPFPCEIFREVWPQIEGSLVSLAVRQGDKTLIQLPGTIISSDGIVATCASNLCYLKSKELKATIDVKVVDTKATYVGVLLVADFCSTVALIKIMSPRQQKVARFVKLDYSNLQSLLTTQSWAIAMGCIPDHRRFSFAESYNCLASIRSVANEIENEQTDARTSGRVIKAELDDILSFTGGPLVDPDFKGSFIGGPLVNSHFGVVGVIHYEDCCGIKATPINDVLKCLELFKKPQGTS